MNDLDHLVRRHVQPGLYAGEHVLGIAFGFREPPLAVRLLFFWLPIVRVLATNHYFAVATSHRFVLLRARAGFFSGRPERWVGDAYAAIDYAHLAKVEAKTFLTVKSLVFTLRDGTQKRINLKPSVAGLPGQVEMYRQYADWLGREIVAAGHRAAAAGVPLYAPMPLRAPAQPSPAELAARRAIAGAAAHPLFAPAVVTVFGVLFLVFALEKLSRALSDYEYAADSRRYAKSQSYDAKEKARQLALAEENEADARTELAVASVAGAIGIVVVGAGIAFGVKRRRNAHARARGLEASPQQAPPYAHAPAYVPAHAHAHAQSNGDADRRAA